MIQVNKGYKIADFSEMLTALTERSKHGIVNIHTLSVIPEGYHHNICYLHNGILFDGQDEHNQAVRYASLKPDRTIEVEMYFGNYEENVDKELDSRIKVKACTDAKTPYVVVEVTGNGGYYRYIIADGNCNIDLGLVKRVADE